LKWLNRIELLEQLDMDLLRLHDAAHDLEISYPTLK